MVRKYSIVRKDNMNIIMVFQLVWHRKVHPNHCTRKFPFWVSLIIFLVIYFAAILYFYRCFILSCKAGWQLADTTAVHSRQIMTSFFLIKNLSISNYTNLWIQIIQIILKKTKLLHMYVHWNVAMQMKRKMSVIREKISWVKITQMAHVKISE